MKKMTEGNPLYLIISFALPVLLGNLFQTFYNIVDLSIVNKALGQDALAGVGSTFPITGLIFGFINGLNNGFSIIISQHFGAGNTKEMKRSLAATMVMAFGITLILTVLCYFFAKDILLLLNTSPTLINDAYDYISVLFLGMLFTMLYNMFAGILRAIGNSIIPLVFLVVSALLNIVLDYVFVIILPYGIKGAASATIVSQAISAFLCFLYIRYKCPHLHIHKEDFRFSFSLFSKLFSTGISMALMLAVVNIGSVILQSGINGLDEEIIAAHTTARKIMEMLMMPLATICVAVATFTGQNYGAGNMARVKQGTKAGLLLCFSWSAIACLAVFFFTPQLLQLIAEDNNAGILKNGSTYLKVGLPFFFPLSVLLVLRNVLQGIGQRIVPVVVSGTELLGKIIAIQFLVPRYEYFGVCITEPVIWVIDGILVLVYYLIYCRSSRVP